MSSYGDRLRSEIARRKILPFVGVYDAFSASIAGRSYDALFVSGFSFAASFYGLPDVGFISWSDMLAFVQRVRGLLPRHHILVDVDDGYGDSEVACHVVSLLAQAGASGIVLEDQRRPRKCGHFEGKQILELEEFLEKLNRVLRVRGDLFVVARTDASDPADILRRVEAFAAAGADAVMVDGLRDPALLDAMRQRVGAKLAFNQIAGGRTPVATLTELSRSGVSVVIYSTPCLFPAQAAIEAAMADLQARDGRLQAPATGTDLTACNALLHENLARRQAVNTPRSDAPAAVSEAPSAPPPPSTRAPLSFAQQRLWFLDRLEPNLSIYNLPLVTRLKGELDVAALGRSLSGVIARHAALRTRFEERDGVPAQVVEPPAQQLLPVEDLRDAGDPEGEALRLAAAEIREPFDLRRAPLLRARLFRIGDRDHVFAVTMHHIVSDGWSVGIFLKELSAFYQAHAAGGTPKLPDLPIQYPDFAVWQRHWMQGKVLAEQLDYWKTALAGAPPVLELPADHPRAAAQTFHGGRHRILLPARLGHALAALGRGEGATPFMTLLAAFSLLLSRYTGQEDVVVGTPIAGRNRLETEELIGLFVNTLVVRSDLSGDPGFRELLRRVRENALGAYSHQDLPFEKLVEELQPERSLSHTPLFQVMFMLQNAPREKRMLAGLEATTLKLERGTARFDLSLQVVEEPEGLSCAFVFNADLFEPRTIERLGRRFERLLEEAAASPDGPISTISLGEDPEELRLLGDWNATDHPFPAECVHRLIEAQARKTPDRVALEGAGEKWTYADLDDRAERLARRLRARGVGPGALVAVSLERSPRLVAALLAVLKAGGAYLPLDPAHPAQRHGQVLEDSGAALLLTASGLPAAGAAGDVPVLLIEDPGAAGDGDAPGTPAAASPSPSDLAYVIYTSGSTGRPKGVEVEHRSVANLLAAMAREPGIREDDVLLAVTTVSFDIAALELFLPLTVGARVVVACEEASADPARLGAEIAASGATIMQATPATWRMLVLGGWSGRAGLKVLCGGEALPADLAGQLRSRAAAVWNLYGPTEATIWTSRHRVSDGDDAGVVPIGRAIENTRLHVLDARGRPAPLGLPGELAIAGAGVARGYRNRPDENREKFVPDPYRAGGRLYKTGDLARFREDGALLFLGRRDGQVKVRGFRIELGEIETALAEHPGVREAAVAARGEDPADRRLVAFVVPGAGGMPSGGALRAHLRTRLPDFMVPSLFEETAALPLTPAGKLDRRALPETDQPSGRGRDLSPASTETEKVLSAIWAALLGLDRIGVHESFFELGGHSLVAVRVFSRIREQLGVELPMRALFESPTVAGLSEAIDRARSEEPPDDAIAPVSRRILRQVETAPAGAFPEK